MSNEMNIVVKKSKTQKSKEEFIEIINSEYDGVMTGLKDYVDELAIFAWSVCNLSYVTIGFLLDRTLNSVAIKRSRMKKKILSKENENSPFYHKLFSDF